MSTRASVRFALPVIGACLLCACQDARSLAEAALAKPQQWIEARRKCQLERINHRAEHCMHRQAEAQRTQDAVAGDRQ